MNGNVFIFCTTITIHLTIFHRPFFTNAIFFCIKLCCFSTHVHFCCSEINIHCFYFVLCHIIYVFFISSLSCLCSHVNYFIVAAMFFYSVVFPLFFFHLFVCFKSAMYLTSSLYAHTSYTVYKFKIQVYRVCPSHFLFLA